MSKKFYDARSVSPACKHWRKKAVQLISATRMPFNDSIWSSDLAAMYPLTANSLRSAASPAGYVGARRRWIEWTLRLLQGHHLEIAVLGGSMPWGSMVEESERYSNQLERHFHEAGFPNVRVENLAAPSTSSEWVAARQEVYSKRMANASMVIVDYAINDYLYTHRAHGSAPHAAMESYDELLQFLIQLPQKLVVIEFGSTNYPPAKFRPTMDCTADVSQFAHSRAERFQVPIVSFGDSFCDTHQPWWFGNQHPNATTHDLVARMFLGVFGAEVERACLKGPSSSADYPQLPPLRERPYSRCFREHSLQSVDYRSMADGMVDGFVEGRPSGGWHFGRDLATKPTGWLVGDGDGRALRASNVISFGVNATEGGWIRLDYLSTYNKMGAATCWLEGTGPERGCLIDGRSSMQFSEDASFFMKVVRGASTGLHCRAAGGKFKILGLAACG